jgi:hypothetical protein
MFSSRAPSRCPDINGHRQLSAERPHRLGEHRDRVGSLAQRRPCSRARSAALRALSPPSARRLPRRARRVRRPPRRVRARTPLTGLRVRGLGLEDLANNPTAGRLHLDLALGERFGVPQRQTVATKPSDYSAATRFIFTSSGKTEPSIDRASESLPAHPARTAQSTAALKLSRRKRVQASVPSGKRLLVSTRRCRISARPAGEDGVGGVHDARVAGGHRLVRRAGSAPPRGR